jgi:hypothetical protein
LRESTITAPPSVAPRLITAANPPPAKTRRTSADTQRSVVTRIDVTHAGIQALGDF